MFWTPNRIPPLVAALAAGLALFSGSAAALPTLVQSPALPAATATFTSILEGVVASGGFPPGGDVTAGPVEVFVPVDGTTTISAAGGASNQFTPFEAPTVIANASASVSTVTSNGSAVTDASGRTRLSYSIRIVPISAPPSPPSSIPVVFFGELSTPADGVVEVGSAFVHVFTPPVGTRFSLSVLSPFDGPYNQTRSIQVNVVHQVDLEAFGETGVQNATSVPAESRAASSSAWLNFAFDQAQFDSDRATAGLPTFDLESAYVIEVGPPLLVSGGEPPAVPLGDTAWRTGLTAVLVALGAGLAARGMRDALTSTS